MLAKSDRELVWFICFGGSFYFILFGDPDLPDLVFVVESGDCVFVFTVLVPNGQESCCRPLAFVVSREGRRGWKNARQCSKRFRGNWHDTGAR